MLKELASAATNLSQEEPPAEFQVDFRPKAYASVFGRFEFLNTVIWTMAHIAFREWDSIIPSYKSATIYHVAIGFVSNRFGPGLKAKHIMWALDKIFDIIVNDDRYLSGNLVVNVGSTALGVGSVYSTVAKPAPVNPSGNVVQGSTDAAVLGSTQASRSALSDDKKLSIDSVYLQENASTTPTLLLSHISNDSMPLNASGNVHLGFGYREGGALVDDAQVYNTSLKLLLKAADHPDLKRTIWPGLSTYNDKDDFSFTLRPASYAARDDVSWWDSIFALSTIAVQMSKAGGSPGRFAEMDGYVKVGTTITARFCIDKGDKTGLDLQDVCDAHDQKSSNYGDGVATA